jgi:hypothetical protein
MFSLFENCLINLHVLFHFMPMYDHITNCFQNARNLCEAFENLAALPDDCI